MSSKNMSSTTLGPDAFASMNMTLDTGATSFMFAASGLVQLMTPGLALYYAGFVPSGSAVSVMIQVIAGHGLVFFLWVLCGFSCVFGEPWITVYGYHLLGNPLTYFAWSNVSIYAPLQRASEIVVKDIPGMLFAAYQGMFAVITPGLLCGAAVDRIKFWSYICFLPFWLLLVYAPLGYWNWGGGWMWQIGAWDFAGGIVVHEAAGFSGLAFLILLGKRSQGTKKNTLALKTPHSLPLMVAGQALLWFGWFGFNGGSAMAIGGLATIAFVNTQIAPSAAMVSWLLLEQLFYGRPTLLGALSGAIAGLVIITPCAGFVQPMFAALIGVIGSIACFGACKFIDALDLDDTCDTFGLHGVAGFLGMVFVGIFSDDERCRVREDAPSWCANPGTVTRSFDQAVTQLISASFAAFWAFFGTVVIFKTLAFLGAFPLLDNEQLQNSARDYEQHGEFSYLNLTPLMHSQPEVQVMSRKSCDSSPFAYEEATSDSDWDAAHGGKDGLQKPSKHNGGQWASMRCLAVCEPNSVAQWTHLARGTLFGGNADAA